VQRSLPVTIRRGVFSFLGVAFVLTVSYTVGMALLSEDQQGELEFWIRNGSTPRPLKAFLSEVREEIRIYTAAHVIGDRLKTNVDKRPTYEQAPELDEFFRDVEARILELKHGTH
jgi:hypothetical protein